MTAVTTAPASAAPHTVTLPPRSWRTPIVLAVAAALTLVLFGFLGRDETTDLVWSGSGDAVVVPATTVVPRVLALVLGLVALAVAAWAVFRAWKRQPVGIWASIVVAIAFLFSLMTWVGAGNQVLIPFLLTNTVALSTAIVLGAMAGVIGERVGVVNIAIEAQLLGGAFTAAFVSSTTHNQIVGLVAAMVTGALISMVLAAFAIVYVVDQVIVGVVLIGLVTAVTRLLYATVLGPDSGTFNNPGTLPKIRIPLLADIPVLGSVLFEQRLTTYLMFLIVPAVWFVLFKTKVGLRVRALGEHPQAADTVGIDVNRWRFWTVTIAGLIAGLGGAAMTIGSVGAFVNEMSAGNGFIALAAVILGRWHPIYAALAALLFGFASAFRIWTNQAGAAIPTDLIEMTPYVVTILAVTLVAGRVVGPRATGKPYIKG
ncbi:ABC transporter permease [Microbacterium stercoris]|uniref:ABC transporter permease n=1 Tax=Microbacterium stercoris TaxID=2820289 RepID=A0A939QUI1_9MICO|nr:ABC transporter permease [Microbacterium stercoris]MBO3664916.1 ABC transporter permease [Microbacterium stercoris]